MTKACTIERLADELFAAVERADMDALAALYTPDAVLWHNSDNRAQPHAENTAMLRSLWQGFIDSAQMPQSGRAAISGR